MANGQAVSLRELGAPGTPAPVERAWISLVSKIRSGPESVTELM